MTCQAKPAAEYAGKGWNGRSPEEPHKQQSVQCFHTNEAHYSHAAAIRMHQCASNDRIQQEAAKLANCDLESTKTVIVCHMEGRLGLTKASLSVLEGMGGSVLQEVWGLGGHTLQHQVQAAWVADGQGEAQDDHLHLVHCLWAFTSTATLPTPAGSAVKVMHSVPTRVPTRATRGRRAPLMT